MAIHTSFAKKVIRSEDSDDCFLAPLRNDGEFYLAFWMKKTASASLPCEKTI
jgi:hypothetical protein